METTISVKTLEFRKLQTFEVAGIIFTVVYFRYILLYFSLYFHLLHFFLTPHCCSMRVISLRERQALMLLVNLALYIILVQISYMLTDCVDQSTGFVQTFFFFFFSCALYHLCCWFAVPQNNENTAVTLPVLKDGVWFWALSHF